MMRGLLHSIAAVALLAGCSDVGVDTDADTTTSQATEDEPTEDEPTEEEVPPGYVSRAELGRKWPLTVDDGTLSCDADAVVFTAPDGDEYGVNGTALTAGYDRIDPIWAPDKALGMGLKKDIGPLIDRGLALCD